MPVDFTVFNLSVAKCCAQVCSDVYDRVTGESNLAHYLIVDGPGYRMAMLRGTHKPLDWITDAKVKFVEYPKGTGLMVHSGFNESGLSVRDDMIGKLKALPPMPTIIGGHSKGAGEAREIVDGLTQEEISAINYAGSYTFGEPRSLSRLSSLRYDERFGKTTFRVVHEEDLVARIPWLCGRYRHSGQRVLLTSFGTCVVNPSRLALLLSDGLGYFKAWRARSFAGLADESFEDHPIDRYIAALGATPFGTLSGVLTQA